MFYALSKTLDLLLSPVLWALLLAVACAWALRRGRERAALRLGLLAGLGLYLPATPLVARPLCRYVERFEGRPEQASMDYDAVIVLGGFAGRGPDGDSELSEGGDRLLRTFELLIQGRAQRAVIVAGGEDPQEVEADVIAELLLSMGIPRERMLLGRTSRNTRENALETKAIVERAKLDKLVVVTSAFHMQRALECMRAVGLRPDALATDHQVPSYGNLFDALAPRASNLAASERALRELAGRWVYRARGFAEQG